MNVDLYKQSGEKAGTLDLPKEIFEVPFNKDLIHQALVRQAANKRVNLANTKTREFIRGGGIKPRPQKGSGRSRQGSTRSPQWRGGAVLFGPLATRNFSKDMPKKQRKIALFSALSEKVRENSVIGLEEFESKDMKTKMFAEMVKKLPIERNALFIIAEKDETITRSSKNIPEVKTILAPYVNIQDLQKYKTVVILKNAVAKLKETFLKQ
ncbi:50S ribosomal protein L4 [Candidatus Gracilibacteria bacterium]|jgi:large subunit ribosomal protein L4|nr:50S ribosomal protein L4 [Candidatus Gracilibacteria bacterium]